MAERRDASHQANLANSPLCVGALGLVDAAALQVQAIQHLFLMMLVHLGSGASCSNPPPQKKKWVQAEIDNLTSCCSCTALHWTAQQEVYVPYTHTSTFSQLFVSLLDLSSLRGKMELTTQRKNHPGLNN